MAGDEPIAHFVLGMACLWSWELDRARAEAERCITLSPNSGEFLRLMAHIQIFSGDPAEAIETLGVYMRLDPHYTETALQFLAEAYVSLGEYEEEARRDRAAARAKPSI